MHNLYLAILTCLITLSGAMADGPITLKASTGENIRIWFATKHITDGNSASSYAYGIHVVVDDAVPGASRIVLINNCNSSNQWTSTPSQTVYNCEYGSDGTWVNQKNCSIQIRGNADYNSEAVIVWWANHGGDTNCYQQIAVSPTFNHWLIDPVSGQNNFNFRFPIPPRSY